jgi:hypothetical protein
MAGQIMKTHLSIILLLLTGTSCLAQFRWDAGIKAGVSNYLGDIGGNERTRRDFLNDIKLGETRASLGTFIRYRIARDISVLASYNYGRIEGDDKLSSNIGRHYRNLNFRNDIHELAVEGHYYFYTLNDLGRTYLFENNFRTYVGVGAAAFYHDPKTFYNGSWVDLRPLKTEGESKPYSKVCLAIPMSMGFYFTFKKSYRIGWEICWRKTFTDYLDDVSGRYASPKALSSPLAIELANRTGALHPPLALADNYVSGSKRGDPANDDAYIFSTINLSYVFKGNGRWDKRSDWQIHEFLRRNKKTLRVRF